MKPKPVSTFSGVSAREPLNNIQRRKLSNPICSWNGTHLWWTLCGNIIIIIIIIFPF